MDTRTVFKEAPKIKIEELENIEANWAAVWKTIHNEKPGGDVLAGHMADGPVQTAGDDRAGPVADVRVRHAAEDLLEPAADDQQPMDEPAADGPSHAQSFKHIAEMLRETWEASNKWWTDFFNVEKSYWSTQPDDAVTGEYPKDQHFVDFPSELSATSRVLTQSEKSMAKRLIAALDDLSMDVSDILPASNEIAKTMKVAHTLETNMERPEEEDVLYLYSSQGTKPDRRIAYEPTTDLVVGHVAVVKVQMDDSSGLRGWDVVEVKSLPVNGEVECVYLKPLYSGAQKLVYTETQYPTWPEDWMDHKLVPITVGVRRKATWTGDIPIDAFQFSCEPTKGMKIQRKYHTSMLLACQSIEKDTRAEAVQSDGDNADIAEEEEMEEEEDGDGDMEEEKEEEEEDEEGGEEEE